MGAASKERPLFFPALDIVRGFAAVTVVMYHVIEYTEWRDFGLAWPTVWFRYGWMGVDIFFVLSGFVITLAALRGYAASEDKGTFRKQFALARLARIAPLHYLTCAVYLMCTQTGRALFARPLLANARRAAAHIAAHVLFVHNLSPQTLSSINGVNWSLAVELELYLIIMLLAGWLSRVRPGTVLACTLPVAWCWRAFAFVQGVGRAPAPVQLTWYYTTNVLGNADFFGVGAALALVATSKAQTRARRLFDRPLACGACSLAVLVPAFHVLAPRAGAYWELWPMVVFFRTLSAVGWGLMIAAACGVTSPRVLGHPLVVPLTYSGKISYGVYLWHMMVVLALQRAGAFASPPLTAALALAGSFAAASLSWHLFEEPCLKAARRWAPGVGARAKHEVGLPQVAAGAIKARRAA